MEGKPLFGTVQGQNAYFYYLIRIWPSGHLWYRLQKI